jgi:hypothetical protein
MYIAMREWIIGIVGSIVPLFSPGAHKCKKQEENITHPPSAAAGMWDNKNSKRRTKKVEMS